MNLQDVHSMNVYISRNPLPQQYPFLWRQSRRRVYLIFSLGRFVSIFYALCILAGIIVCLWLSARRWAQVGGTRERVYDVAMWAIPAGIIGARAYHVLITDLAAILVQCLRSLGFPEDLGRRHRHYGSGVRRSPGGLDRLSPIPD